MDLKSEKILIWSVFVVLISSWFIGNLMDMSVDQDSEPVFLGVPEEVFIVGMILLLTTPILYLSIVYLRSESNDRMMVSELLLLGFWIFASIGGLLFVVLAVWPLAMQVRLEYFLGVEVPSLIFLLDIGFVLLLLLLGALFTYYIYLNIPGGKDEREKTDISLPKKELKKREDIEDSFYSTLDKAITDLDRGGEIRTTIINCYREMSMLLEEKGAKNHHSMTPREFKKYTIEKMPKAEKLVSDITYLFEEARYSPHDLDESHRSKVLQQLKELRRGSL